VSKKESLFRLVLFRIDYMLDWIHKLPFISDGICVESEIEKTLDASAVGYTFKFDSGASYFDPAPTCNHKSEITFNTNRFILLDLLQKFTFFI